jgi:hypothetical protein
VPLLDLVDPAQQPGLHDVGHSPFILPTSSMKTARAVLLPTGKQAFRIPAGRPEGRQFHPFALDFCFAAIWRPETDYFSCPSTDIPSALTLAFQ